MENAWYFVQMRFSQSCRIGHTHGWPSAKHNFYFVFGTIGWFWKEPFWMVFTVNSTHGTQVRRCWVSSLLATSLLVPFANLPGSKCISPFRVKTPASHTMWTGLSVFAYENHTIVATQHHLLWFTAQLLSECWYMFFTFTFRHPSYSVRHAKEYL